MRVSRVLFITLRFLGLTKFCNWNLSSKNTQTRLKKFPKNTYTHWVCSNIQKHCQVHSFYKHKQTNAFRNVYWHLNHFQSRAAFKGNFEEIKLTQYPLSRNTNHFRWTLKLSIEMLKKKNKTEKFQLFQGWKSIQQVSWNVWQMIQMLWPIVGAFKHVYCFFLAVPNIDELQESTQSCFEKRFFQESNQITSIF
jgi:hypothetical protein